jgi:hypothetical protein
MKLLSVLAAGLAVTTPYLAELEVVVLGATVPLALPIPVATGVLLNTYHVSPGGSRTWVSVR